MERNYSFKYGNRFTFNICYSCYNVVINPTIVVSIAIVEQGVPILAAELTQKFVGKDRGGRGAVFVCTASIAGNTNN